LCKEEGLGDILDEATRKDLFTDAFCKVCSAVLQSESQRMSHYESKKHARKVCLYTQMHAEKDERQKHGKKKKLDLACFQVHRSGEEDKYCCLCNMFFSCPITALSHYLGKIHAKNLKQKPAAEKPLLPSKAEEFASASSTSLELNDTKYCRLCCVPLDNLFSAQQHYVGKKHRRNIARKKIMEELGDEALLAEVRINGKQNVSKWGQSCCFKSLSFNKLCYNLKKMVHFDAKQQPIEINTAFCSWVCMGKTITWCFFNYFIYLCL
uniref:U1-type domain-containing protein n=1 Tax=Anas platyrhynchos TaxID=8839 RepID=A0A8B9SJE9_ANAPL